MLTWLKILCAIDFSESSRFALEHAADLARRFDAELTLIHVLERVLPSDVLLPPPELSEADAIECRGKLEAWRVEAELPARAVVARGAAAAEIVARAREGDFDLIVTGTHSRKGLRRALLGSVAERIAREAPCPVLIARQPPEWGD